MYTAPRPRETELQLPKSLEYLELGKINVNLLNLISNLQYLKSLCISEIEITNGSLLFIANKCLELEHLSVECKFLKVLKIY